MVVLNLFLALGVLSGEIIIEPKHRAGKHRGALKQNRGVHAYLLRVHYVPGAVLGTGDTTENKETKTLPGRCCCEVGGI